MQSLCSQMQALHSPCVVPVRSLSSLHTCLHTRLHTVRAHVCTYVRTHVRAHVFSLTPTHAHANAYAQGFAHVYAHVYAQAFEEPLYRMRLARYEPTPPGKCSRGFRMAMAVVN